MITITISPKDAQQMGVIAEVLKGLMEGLQPPATPPTREEMDKALKVAEEIHHKVEAPKVAKSPKPTAAAPAAATPTPQAASQETSAAQPTQAVAVPPAAESPSEEAAPAPAPTIGTIAYDTVAKHITEVVKSDRAKVVAALAKFGVKKGTELKPSQYAEFLKAIA